MDEKMSCRPHRLELTDRQKSTVTGITEVISFDENQVIFDTELGALAVRGSGLHVSRISLEQGEAELEGKFDSFSYADGGKNRKSGESLLRRLLR